MKLIIQIPCYNEAGTLQKTLEDLPKKIDGIDIIETLIIDDGSTDKTVDVARKNGVHHVVSFKNHKGLARAFVAGIEKCLELKADIIVNTDADNQYPGREIPKIVEPILLNQADIVVGDRQTDKISNFSPIKKLLQRIGSGVVRMLSEVDVPDAVSGFRAYSREAAMRINILTEFSYTIENLIQLGTDRFKIVSVPINANITLRKSRLHKGALPFIMSQVQTMIRSYAMYKALQVFTLIGLLFLLPGLFIGLRFLYFFLTAPSQTTGHIQSLIFAAILIIIAFIFFVLGIIADLVSNNRRLIEKLIMYQVKHRR